MFIQVSTLNGGVQAIRTDTIVRFRPSHGPFEPQNATVIDYGDQRFLSADSSDEVAQNIGSELPLARLTTPNNLDLFVNASKVIDIAEPISGVHHPRARAVVRLTGTAKDVRAQVRETFNQARTKVEQALS